MKTSFNFYKETAMLMLDLDNETIGKFFRAIVEERITNKEPPKMTGVEKIAYATITLQLDKDFKNRKAWGENGKKGVGRHNKSNEKTVSSQS